MSTIVQPSVTRTGIDPRGPQFTAAITAGVLVIVLATVGALDEWHQSWVPGRSGNDPGDWLADVVGALTGGLVFKRFHCLLDRALPDSSSAKDLP